MDARNCYLVEVGVLLKKDNPEYEAYKNKNVYDGSGSFYDEDQFYELSEEKAKEYALKYVKEGIGGTYGIVKKTFIPEEDAVNMENGIDAPYVEGESYDVSSVVFSVHKNDDGEMIPLFKDQVREEDMKNIIKNNWRNKVISPISVYDSQGSCEYMVTYRDSSVDFQKALEEAAKEDIQTSDLLKKYVREMGYFTIYDAISNLSQETLAKHGLIIEPYDIEQIEDINLLTDEVMKSFEPEQDGLEREE